MIILGIRIDCYNFTLATRPLKKVSVPCTTFKTLAKASNMWVLQAPGNISGEPNCIRQSYGALFKKNNKIIPAVK